MRNPVVWIWIALLAFTSKMVTPYFEGCSNSWWVIPPMLPADLLPLLLLFVSCVVLLSRWVRSLLAKRRAIPASLMFFATLFLFGASLKVPPAYLFLRGFSHYAKSVLTTDEWRNISRFAQEHLQPEGRLPGPRKNLWNETEHRALWSALAAATQIQKLDLSLMIFVHPEHTEIVWGGALEGHRGVTIYTRRSGGNQHDTSSHSLSIAEDIAVLISAD
jgi:hypothetical protein